MRATDKIPIRGVTIDMEFFWSPVGLATVLCLTLLSLGGSWLLRGGSYAPPLTWLDDIRLGPCPVDAESGEELMRLASNARCDLIAVYTRHPHLLAMADVAEELRELACAAPTLSIAQTRRSYRSLRAKFERLRAEVQRDLFESSGDDGSEPVSAKSSRSSTITRRTR